jgi:predicted ribosomally synthesized peptide with nif11-like leader
MSAWKKIQERMAADKEFAAKIRDMMSLDDVIQYCEEVGFRFTDEELEDQFPFTQQMASTDEGVLKAVT